MYDRSGVLDPNYFPKLMEEIIKNIDAIMKSLDIKFNHVSMGGGFGIPYDDNQTPLNFDKVFKGVSDTFHSFFKDKDVPELWIEPGKSCWKHWHFIGICNRNQKKL